MYKIWANDTKKLSPFRTNTHRKNRCRTGRGHGGQFWSNERKRSYWKWGGGGDDSLSGQSQPCTTDWSIRRPSEWCIQYSINAVEHNIFFAEPAWNA